MSPFATLKTRRPRGDLRGTPTGSLRLMRRRRNRPIHAGEPELHRCLVRSREAGSRGRPGDPARDANMSSGTMERGLVSPYAQGEIGFYGQTGKGRDHATEWRLFALRLQPTARLARRARAVGGPPPGLGRRPGTFGLRARALRGGPVVQRLLAAAVFGLWDRRFVVAAGRGARFWTGGPGRGGQRLAARSARAGRRTALGRPCGSGRGDPARAFGADPGKRF